MIWLLRRKPASAKTDAREPSTVFLFSLCFRLRVLWAILTILLVLFCIYYSCCLLNAMACFACVIGEQSILFIKVNRHIWGQNAFERSRVMGVRRDKIKQQFPVDLSQHSGPRGCQGLGSQGRCFHVFLQSFLKIPQLSSNLSDRIPAIQRSIPLPTNPWSCCSARVCVCVYTFV